MTSYRWSLLSVGLVLAAAAILAQSSGVHESDAQPIAPSPGQNALPSPHSERSELYPAVLADELHGVGIYEGDYGEGPRHTAGFHPTGNALVEVERPGQLVALALTSYEPTLWTLRVGRTTKLTTVILSGYHKQSVRGAGPETRIVQSSYDHPGPFKPFRFHTSASSSRDSREPDPVQVVVRLSGQGLASLQTSYSAPTSFQISAAHGSKPAVP